MGTIIATSETLQTTVDSTTIAAGFAVLLIYLFYRHVMLTLVVMDLILGFLRQFSWFPGPGKRLYALLQWVIAVFVLVAFFVIAVSAGWLTTTWR